MPNRDYFYLKTGKKKLDLQRSRPTAQDVISRRLKQVKSKYPVREIGVGQERLYLTEEERESHMHIIGTTSEGKSRFLQHLIQGDIQQGNGLCLLDPSENGDTMYSVLRYCRKIGYEKVCVIDPHLNLTGINPFNRHYKNASVANIMDTVRILFKTADDSDVPRIRRYLPALLRVLWESEMTLYDTLYFSDYENPSYVARRRRIYERLAPLDADLITLEGVFKTYSRWENYFASTVNRLDPFWHSKLGLMFGVKDGVQFDKLVTEKWVILVNLYAGLGFEPIHTRLLGTTIINEILFAIDRLQLHGWKGAYYLYIDEAGRYANRNLAELLNKRKSGLRVTLAHQYFSQFEDRVVLDAVKQMPKIKVMFNTPSHVDRLEMVKARSEE